MRFYQTIKFRLTIWYLVVTAVLLLIFGTIAYVMLFNNLSHDLDYNLTSSATAVKARLASGESDIAEEPVVEHLNELILIYQGDGTILRRYGANVELPGMDGFVKQSLNSQGMFFTSATGSGQEMRFYASSFLPLALMIAPSSSLLAGP